MSPLESGAGHGETVRVVCAQQDDAYVLALVKKRTYSIGRDGGCELAEEQQPVTQDVVYEEEAEPPEVAAPRWDNDCFALKPRIDVLVRGEAQSYGRRVTSTVVEARIGEVYRRIKVYGDRVCEWQGGRPTFSPPEPFETMPVGYDRAYGGFDAEVLEREGDAFADAFRKVRPEWKVDATTWCHYPRNPSGTGYVIAGVPRKRPVRVPNLEFPFDPVTPDRLAVSPVERWMSAPLPAALDWVDQTWFPRSGYLGLIPPHASEDVPPPEVRFGFAPEDLLQSRSIFDLGFRHEFLQGASAGLSFWELRPGEEVLVRNMFEEAPDFVVRLPMDRPRMAVEPRGQDRQEMDVHLNTVMVDAVAREVVQVWSGRLGVWRPFGPQELEEIPYWIGW